MVSTGEMVLVMLVRRFADFQLKVFPESLPGSDSIVWRFVIHFVECELRPTAV